jgi:hypothetical protein
LSRAIPAEKTGKEVEAEKSLVRARPQARAVGAGWAAAKCVAVVHSPEFETPIRRS